MLSNLIDRFQAKFPANRLAALAMALLTPLVVTPAATYVAAWLPAHFPGLPTFTPTQLTVFAVTGGLAALVAGITAGYKFIDGWQDHEERTFFGKPLPGEDSDRVEIAKIEAEAKKMVALVEAGHLPESLLDLVHGAPPASTPPLPPPPPIPAGAGGVAEPQPEGQTPAPAPPVPPLPPK